MNFVFMSYLSRTTSAGAQGAKHRMTMIPKIFQKSRKGSKRSAPTGFLVLSVGLALGSLNLAAQSVPPLVDFQGRLANPDGTPLVTANYQLSLRVYDAATNGNLMWGPQVFDGQAAQGHGLTVPVVQGYFNVILGPTDTNGASLIAAFGGTGRYFATNSSQGPPILSRPHNPTTPFGFDRADSAEATAYEWSSDLWTQQ